MQLQGTVYSDEIQNCQTNINCNPITVPEKKAESHYKIIDGITYMVGPSNQYTNTNYISFGTIHKSGTFQEYTPINFEAYLDTSIQDFWFDDESQSLILLQSPGKGDGAAVEIFSKVSGSTQKRSYPLDYSILFANQVLEIYARSRIIDYDPESQQLLVLTMVGDACAGWGSVWKVLPSTATKVNISQVSSGCHDTNPRFAGYLNGKLYIINADSEFIEPGEYYTRDTVHEFFTIDPKTLVRETVSVDLA